MDKGKIYTTLVLGGMMMALLMQPVQAEPRFEGRRDHRHHHHKVFCRHHHHDSNAFGSISFKLPKGYISITVGGSRYHYHEGIYYRRASHGYIVTPPPIGACIQELPYGYTVIYVDDAPYYTFNGVYYEHTPRGHVVIEPPERIYARIGHQADSQETITVNIPNKKGGYTAVLIRRSNGGFIGPQGEFYEEFPPVDTLQVIYGS